MLGRSQPPVTKEVGLTLRHRLHLVVTAVHIQIPNYTQSPQLPEPSIMLIGCPLPVKAFPAISLDRLSSKYHNKARSLVNARQGEWRFWVE